MVVLSYVIIGRPETADRTRPGGRACARQGHNFDDG
jgi:hypothetical protein